MGETGDRPPKDAGFPLVRLPVFEGKSERLVESSYPVTDGATRMPGGVSGQDRRSALRSLEGVET